MEEEKGIDENSSKAVNWVRRSHEALLNPSKKGNFSSCLKYSYNRMGMTHSGLLNQP